MLTINKKRPSPNLLGSKFRSSSVVLANTKSSSELNIDEDDEDEDDDYFSSLKIVSAQMQNQIKSSKKRKISSSSSKSSKKKPKKIVIVKMVEKKNDTWFSKNDALPFENLTKRVEKTTATYQRLIIQSNNMIAKVNDHILAFDGIFLKPNCFLYKNKNNEYFVGIKCLTCEKIHPRTVMFFQRNCKLDKFESASPAHESLQNSISYPCRLCPVPKTLEQFLTQWLGEYAITNDEAKEKMISCNAKGLLSGLPIAFEKGKICLHAIENHGGKNQRKSHSRQNTFFDRQCFNPPQYDAIDCLFKCYQELADTEIDLVTPNIEIFQRMEWSTKQSGVTASWKHEQKLYDKQMKDLHLPTIISLKVRSHINSDIDAGRISSNNLAKTCLDTKKKIQISIIAKIIAQNGKCGFFGYNLSVKNTMYRFSLDRIDDSKAHFLGEDCLDLSNIQIICRIFNTFVKQTVEEHTAMRKYRQSLPIHLQGPPVYL